MKNYLLVILVVLIAGVSSCKHEAVIPDYGMTISPVCDSDTVYFVNDILPFLNANCAQSGCHDSQTAQHGIILESYDDIKNSGVFEPGKSEESKLYTILNEIDLQDIMPPPSTSIELTNDQISKVEAWIDQGARNNACTDLICDSMDISFADHILPLIEQRCKGCHLGTASVGGFPLTNYEQIFEISDYALYQVINHESGYSAMPPNQPKLDSCKLQVVRVWIEEGALNN
ncbi:MAG: hypothetical protein ACI9FU_000298 [Granulosicoccus sp.]